MLAVNLIQRSDRPVLGDLYAGLGHDDVDRAALLEHRFHHRRLVVARVGGEIETGSVSSAFCMSSKRTPNSSAIIPRMTCEQPVSMATKLSNDGGSNSLPPKTKPTNLLEHNLICLRGARFELAIFKIR